MKQPDIHVGILKSDTIRFECKGNYVINNSEKKLKGMCSAKRVGDQIVIERNGKEIMKDAEVSLTPENSDTGSFILKDVVIGISFHWERKEDQEFLGGLRFVKENGKITAVNIIPVEHYLTSVISSEMSATSSFELLKAHSIISRSWLLAQIERAKTKGNHGASKSEKLDENEVIRWYGKEDHRLYDVCADDHCQRYQGITKAYTDSVKKAMEETRGMVLMYGGKICDARYSKSCGGITENFENVWEPVKHEYLISIRDYKNGNGGYDFDFSDERNAENWIRRSPPAFCNTTDKKIMSQVLLDYDQETTDFYRWRVACTQDKISRIIKEKSGIDFGRIIDLVPVERGYSARLIKLKIIGENKTLIIGKELEIRKTLSPSHLYSSAFVVDKVDVKDGIPQKFILTGAGWGHGVGLCQIGAAVMGEKGYSYDEILKHYFRNAELERFY